MRVGYSSWRRVEAVQLLRPDTWQLFLPDDCALELSALEIDLPDPMAPPKARRSFNARPS